MALKLALAVENKSGSLIFLQVELNLNSREHKSHVTSRTQFARKNDLSVLSRFQHLDRTQHIQQVLEINCAPSLEKVTVFDVMFMTDREILIKCDT